VGLALRVGEAALVGAEDVLVLEGVYVGPLGVLVFVAVRVEVLATAGVFVLVGV
jgi:hypothetical protein